MLIISRSQTILREINKANSITIAIPIHGKIKDTTETGDEKKQVSEKAKQPKKRDEIPLKKEKNKHLSKEI